MRKQAEFVHKGISACTARQNAIGQDEHVARRHLAVADVCDGATIIEVAAKNNTAPRTVERWIDIANREGLKGLEALRHPLKLRTDISVRKIKAGIAKLQRSSQSEHARAAPRLLMICEIRQGMTRKEAIKLYPWNTIALWIRRFNEKGIEGLIEERVGIYEFEDPKVAIRLRAKVSAKKIRLMAASASGGFKRRLSVVSHFLDGAHPGEVARRVGVSKSTVRACLAKFDAEGIEALRNHRPRKPRLAIRRDIPAKKLRRAAGTVNKRAANKLIAVAAVLDGRGRLESALAVGASPSSMTNWIHQFNDGGIERLVGAKGGRHTRCAST